MNTEKNILLVDGPSWSDLLPLTFTRPVAELRVGILKIREKWEMMMQAPASFLTLDYLSRKFGGRFSGTNLFIDGSIIPDAGLVAAISSLHEDEWLVSGECIIAVLSKQALNIKDWNKEGLQSLKQVVYHNPINRIQNPWDIFRLNGQEIIADYAMVTRGRKTEKLNKTNQLLGERDIFFEAGVKADFITLNATTGPIYIGRDCEIMEGTVIRGPFALCEGSALKLSTKIYGPTTIGPHCKVGGEVNNSVIQGYSNKAHDGFLGNSVIGEWCNLGAGTNNSNLKNNYAKVKLWNYGLEKFIDTGLQFCGLIMGDHSKCGINSMFNTGTVVGVSANLFGAGFPRNFIPSFSWGGAGGMTIFSLEKAFEVAQTVMERRNIVMDDIDKAILSEVFKRTGKYRQWEPG